METFRTPQLDLIHNVLELAKNINKQQEILLKEFNISHEQLNILIILFYDSCKSSLSLLEIQERMILSTTNTSRLVDKLKEKKLATRKTDSKNRRKVKIQITKKGETLVIQATKKIKDYSKKVNLKISDNESFELSKKIVEINELVLDWY
ncbi:MarR family winged helix-turn-helix transcriptional regulator [Thalassobellus citreus]|uniref:MarR family winged helix-turn-helix transcriptional regulator n=1 Tax=Thalassobellus citreus TaxID=3367752 RepID=UPI0037B88C7B